jgi:hypothetical protein
MLGLVRRRIASPAQWQDFDSAHGASWLALAVSAADIALVSGQLESAKALYSDLLKRDPENFDAWSGLTLTLEDATVPAARALHERPELVKAVYTRLGESDTARDPTVLAEWIGAALA